MKFVDDDDDDDERPVKCFPVKVYGPWGPCSPLKYAFMCTSL